MGSHISDTIEMAFCFYLEIDKKIWKFSISIGSLL